MPPRKNPSRPAPAKPAAPRTLGQWLDHALERYAQHQVAVGQIADNHHDDALLLLLRTLGLPLDSDPAVLDHPLTAAQAKRVQATLHRRIEQHVPTAYLIGETWLGGHRFHVDERVIIPRSYFVELIPGLQDLLPPGIPVRHAADICTGSGCLALLLAHEFKKARVDATDLSPDALDVAAINVREHRLASRVKLHRTDVFADVPSPKDGYDIIISNPPYEPSAHVDRQLPEFKAEPRMAHDGGADGLVIIRKILAQALPRLAPHGVLLIEVGGIQKLINRTFASLHPEWLETEDGSNCVCLFRAVPA
ncbi:MAG: 50S ribosomal protein L3 N(5)-glutamine methyltransferase [Verrucomicrobiota bacterium]